MTPDDYERQIHTLLDVVLTRQESAAYRRDRAVETGEHPMFGAAIGGKAAAYREVAALLDNILQGIEIKAPVASSVRTRLPDNRPGMARTPRGGMSKNRKIQVKARGGWSCHYCGCTPNMLEVEHVVPRSLGGTVALSNLVPACLTCNDDKGPALWAGHCDFCDRAIRIWMTRQMHNLWARWPLKETTRAAA